MIFIDKHEKRRVAINIIMAVIFVVVVTYISVKYGPRITKLASSPQEMRELITSYGWTGVLVFMGIQVLQVVIVIIPGEFVQMAGGYIFGAWAGALFSMAGIMAGTVIVFYVSRLLGYSLVRTFFPEKSLNKFKFVMNSNKLEIAMLVLFLIPGFPKDMLSYIAGITPIKPLRLFAVVFVGRLPGLIASSFIGQTTQRGNYTALIILSAVAVVLFVVGLLNKDRLLKSFHHRSKDADHSKNEDHSKNAL